MGLSCLLSFVVLLQLIPSPFWKDLRPLNIHFDPESDSALGCVLIPTQDELNMSSVSRVNSRRETCPRQVNSDNHASRETTGATSCDQKKKFIYFFLHTSIKIIFSPKNKKNRKISKISQILVNLSRNPQISIFLPETGKIGKFADFRGFPGVPPGNPLHPPPGTLPGGSRNRPPRGMSPHGLKPPRGRVLTKKRLL